jgi:glucose-specific phosphotransferase system IIA component
VFGFGKKKITVAAPVTGSLIDITDVKDEVFSSKMMGDGFAVEPDGDTVVAPCDGKIVLLAKTLHAVALEQDGVQLLIHIGLDTVELDGKGFTAFIKDGDTVKKGDALIQFDREYLTAQQKPLTTMVVITNMDERVKSVEKDLQDKDKVMTIQVK